MAISIQQSVVNPISGVFGTGQVRFFSTSGTWVVPAGIGKVRARLWGGGGGYTGSPTYTGGAGGGFALKAIYDLSGVTSIAVIVGEGGTLATPSGTLLFGGTSSFGAYVSATGGGYSGGIGGPIAGGYGVGGDINNTGGSGYNNGATTGLFAGGAASIFGNGGNNANTLATSFIGGGGGGNNASTATSNGYLGAGMVAATAAFQSTPATSGLVPYSIDYIGTGGGGINGGANSSPGGGSSSLFGGYGLVIVEW